jgi:hypothetical protein
MTKAIRFLILLAATLLAAPAMAADPPNLAEIVQSGLGSAATLTQHGTGDLMSIVQMGDGNIARQTQLGHGNSMSAVQLGNGNSLEHLQLGSGLSPVDIVQQGGAAVTVIQSR